MTSAIRKWGNSAGTLIPARTLAKAGLHIGDEVSIHATVGEIVIRPAQPVYDIDQLLAATPVNRLQRREEDQQWLGDEPVGKELI